MSSSEHNMSNKHCYPDLIECGYSSKTTSTSKKTILLLYRD